MIALTILLYWAVGFIAYTFLAEGIYASNFFLAFFWPLIVVVIVAVVFVQIICEKIKVNR